MVSPHVHETWDYQTALRAIWERSGYDRGYISNPFAGDDAAQLGLRRVEALLDRLGRPQHRYGIVHVAGSKGKGSTCAFLDAIARAAGYRVGRFTSPHLHAFRERIAINGRSIDEETFGHLTQRAVAVTSALEGDSPELGVVTAFELMTAMALDAFAEARCDVAVVEVGLGGLYDATNVVMPNVSVITALDLEHTAILGDTLPEIAAQKAGIIKPGRPVVVSPQAPAALSVIERVARDSGSQVIAADRDWSWSGSWREFEVAGPWGTWANLRSGLVGGHQVDNACTALAATWRLTETDFEISEADARSGLAAARWPGRYERATTPRGTNVVLDGAHSPASAAALAATVAQEEANRPAVGVLGTMADKDQVAIVTALHPVLDQIVATAAMSPRAATPTRIVEAAGEIGLPARALASVAEAVAEAAALAGPDGLVVVTGSLAVVAEARVALGLADTQPDPPFEATIRLSDRS